MRYIQWFTKYLNIILQGNSTNSKILISMKVYMYIEYITQSNFSISESKINRQNFNMLLSFKYNCLKFFFATKF